MAELAFGIVGLVLGAPSFIQALSDYHDRLVALARQHSNANTRTEADLCQQILRLQQTDSHTILQFFENLALTSPDSLPPAFTDEIADLYQTLRSIYEDLIRVLPKDAGKPWPSRTVERVKREIARLDEWNERLMKRATMFMFAAPMRNSVEGASKRDQILRSFDALERVGKIREAVQESITASGSTRKKLLLGPEAIDTEAQVVQLPNSSLWHHFSENSLPKETLVEHKRYSADISTVNLNRMRATVRDIASILHEADPNTMGLLRCRGFLQNSTHNRFELHFEVPPDFQNSRRSNPRSLRSLLNDPITEKAGAVHPLDQRFMLAKRLASAIFYVHSGNFVHKNIRPENIITFTDLSSSKVTKQGFPWVLGSPFLVGYDGVRRVDAASERQATSDWKKSIYLSPSRHRLQPGDEYKVQDDIYSLGVILLEIALWKDLTNNKRPPINFWMNEEKTKLKPAEELKATFVKVAQQNVPRIMGQRYTDAILMCLGGFEQMEDEELLKDEDGVVVDSAYMLHVLKQFEAISL